MSSSSSKESANSSRVHPRGFVAPGGLLTAVEQCLQRHEHDFIPVATMALHQLKRISRHDSCRYSESLGTIEEPPHAVLLGAIDCYPNLKPPGAIDYHPKSPDSIEVICINGEKSTRGDR